MLGNNVSCMTNQASAQVKQPRMVTKLPINTMKHTQQQKYMVKPFPQ